MSLHYDPVLSKRYNHFLSTVKGLQDAVRREEQQAQSHVLPSILVTGPQIASPDTSQEEYIPNQYNIITIQGLFYTTYKQITQVTYKRAWQATPRAAKNAFFDDCPTGFTNAQLAYFGISLEESLLNVKHDYFLRNLNGLLETGFPVKLLKPVLELNKELRCGVKFGEQDLNFAAWAAFKRAWGGVERGPDNVLLRKSVREVLELLGGVGGVEEQRDCVLDVRTVYRPSTRSTWLHGMYKPALVVGIRDNNLSVPRVVVFDLPDQYRNQGLKQLHILHRFAMDAIPKEYEEYKITALFRTPAAQSRILTAHLTRAWSLSTNSCTPMHSHPPPIDGHSILPANATAHVTYTPWMQLSPNRTQIQATVSQWGDEYIKGRTTLSLEDYKKRYLRPGGEEFVRILAALLEPVREMLVERWKEEGGVRAGVCERVGEMGRMRMEMMEREAGCGDGWGRSRSGSMVCEVGSGLENRDG